MIEPLQTAIYQRLSGFTALTDLLATFDYGAGTVAAIYDQVPQVDDASDSSDFPYVVIGEWTTTENDTDTDTGFDTTLTIHTWSRQRDYQECQRVMFQVYNALHRYTGLTPTGYGVSGIHQEFSDLMRDPDGITRHGVQRFRIYFEPTS